MTDLVPINDRLDALIWQCICRIHDEGWDPRVAIEEMFNAINRNHAAYYLGHEWLVDLMRETDVWAKWAAESKPELSEVA